MLLTPTKEKILKNDFYRWFDKALLDSLKQRVRLIDTCPDCKSVAGLNAIGVIVDISAKPIAVIYKCREEDECGKLFSSQIFITI
jgi:hypothetical protein